MPWKPYPIVIAATQYLGNDDDSCGTDHGHVSEYNDDDHVGEHID